MSDTNIPDGFAPFKLTMGFLQGNGPLYGKKDGDALVLGFRVEERHCNPAMVCHGGMLALFADMLLPIAARFQGTRDMGFLPTINLTCDFLAPAPHGAWVEGRAGEVRATRNLLFAQGLATADGTPVLRANGIFKIVGGDAAKDGEFSLSNLFDLKN